MNNPLSLRILGTTIACAMTISMLACNKSANSTGAPASSIAVGAELDDSVVSARVKSVLLADADFKGLDIKVETRKGEVMLSGFVDSLTQMERATMLTHTVEGVRSIDNKLNQKDGTMSMGSKFDDSVITTSLKAALLADPEIKNLDIAVVTRKGEVQLSGVVNNQRQIDRAVELARGIGGVTRVGYNMSIKK